jgi:hypothetical protein
MKKMEEMETLMEPQSNFKNYRTVLHHRRHSSNLSSSGPRSVIAANTPPVPRGTPTACDPFALRMSVRVAKSLLNACSCLAQPRTLATGQRTLVSARVVLTFAARRSAP